MGLERFAHSGVMVKFPWKRSTTMYSFQALPNWRMNAINTQHQRAKSRSNTHAQTIPASAAIRAPSEAIGAQAYI